MVQSDDLHQGCPHQLFIKTKPILQGSGRERWPLRLIWGASIVGKVTRRMPAPDVPLREQHVRKQTGVSRFTCAHEDDIRGLIATADDVGTLLHTLYAGGGHVGHALAGEGHHGWPWDAGLVDAAAVLNRHLCIVCNQNLRKTMRSRRSIPSEGSHASGVPVKSRPCAMGFEITAKVLAKY